MEGIFATYVIPGLIIAGKSLLMLVVLLLIIAYLLYADRKVWAAVQLRRGPGRSRIAPGMRPTGGPCTFPSWTTRYAPPVRGHGKCPGGGPPPWVNDCLGPEISA